jgi:hypothetical protein
MGMLDKIGKLAGDIFMPKPDSLWAGALGPGGIANARLNQQNYLQGQQDRDLNIEAANQELDSGTIKSLGGTTYVVTPRGGGAPEITQTPPVKSETERLIAQWQTLPEGPLRDLVERAIKGAQYSPDVIQAQGDARTGTAVARADAVGRNRPPPVAKQLALPKGFVWDK